MKHEISDAVLQLLMAMQLIREGKLESDYEEIRDGIMEYLDTRRN